MDSLQNEVQALQERWNSMVLDITRDLKITCDEARMVLHWLVSERKSYAVVKKKINLEIRAIRTEYDLRLKLNTDRALAKELRLDMAKAIHPYKTLLLSLDELVLKADEVELRAQRIADGCDEHGQ
jgi:hypothetical protein